MLDGESMSGFRSRPGPGIALWVNSALILCGLALAFTIASCHGSDSNGKQSQDTQAPSPEAKAEAPSEPQSTGLAELADASAQDGLGYVLSGTGDSGVMNLRLTNHTNRVWQVHIEKGLKLEPSDAGVQNMTVTKEVHVTLHSHEEQELDLEVACLDIAKATPAPTDISWTIQQSASLAQFIACVNGLVDEQKAKNPQDSEQYESRRKDLLQASLWKARGATRQDWVEYYTKYHPTMSEEKVQQAVDAREPGLNEIVNSCPLRP
jgi:hypothetical protein